MLFLRKDFLPFQVLASFGLEGVDNILGSEFDKGNFSLSI